MDHLDVTGRSESPAAEIGTKCPKCGAQVLPMANQCPACGEYFPNIDQRLGNPWGGAMLGLVRGLAMVSFVVGGAAGVQLLMGNLGVGNVVTLVIGFVVFGVCLTIARRLHEQTYGVD